MPMGIYIDLMDILNKNFRTVIVFGLTVSGFRVVDLHHSLQSDNWSNTL